MTNTEFLKSLEGQDIPPMFKMYKLWCHCNNLKESNLLNFKAWLEDRLPKEV